MHGEYPRVGRVEWIGLTPSKGAALNQVDRVEAHVGTGLEGDRHCAAGRPGSTRQVTLVQQEHFAVMSAMLERDVLPGDIRRNISVSGINLFSLRFARFRVGDALLQGTGICAPCNRMEKILGPGGFNIMRGMGGITARVIEAGEIAVGAEVAFVEGAPPKGQE